MEQRQLGREGFTVSELGLGCMSMSGSYGPSEDAESVATIHAALDAGVNLLDTGDFYGMGHNELVIREALKGRNRERVQLAVKFGAMRDPRGAFIGIDTRPVAVRNFISYSLQRLGTDYVDFYFPCRVDPNVPIEETVGAVAQLVKEGKVRYIGLSEASAATVERACRVHPIAALEVEYSIGTRDIETTHLPVLRRLGVGVLAYGVLARGLLSGQIGPTASFGRGDFRAHSPRFQSGNLEKNLDIVEKLQAFAAGKECTVSQLCFAWLLAQGPDIVPLIGTKRRQYLHENLAATRVQLTTEDLATLDRLMPRGAVAGERYPPEAMQQVNR